MCEGVFQRFPGLKIVIIEGGFAWMAPLMWRLDAAWKLLKSEVPFLDRKPSEIIREHFWVTTQPVEEPHRPHEFAELMAQIAMPDRLMFATDYPHWDFDAPDQAVPRTLDPRHPPRHLRRECLRPLRVGSQRSAISRQRNAVTGTRERSSSLMHHTMVRRWMSLTADRWLLAAAP